VLSQSQRDLFGHGVTYLFVGGYGFLLFVYPEKALRIFGQTPAPNKIKLAKAVGAIELVIVLFAVLAYLVAAFR
jgi:hypothetical protein